MVVMAVESNDDFIPITGDGGHGGASFVTQMGMNKIHRLPESRENSLATAIRSMDTAAIGAAMTAAPSYFDRSTAGSLPLVVDNLHAEIAARLQFTIVLSAAGAVIRLSGGARDARSADACGGIENDESRD